VQGPNVILEGGGGTYVRSTSSSALTVQGNTSSLETGLNDVRAGGQAQVGGGGTLCDSTPCVSGSQDWDSADYLEDPFTNLVQPCERTPNPCSPSCTPSPIPNNPGTYSLS